jgi:hypothetical protein
MSDKIVLGSGKLYIDSVSATSGVYTIPADSTIEADAKLLGYIKGGATLEYTPTFYTVKDDLGYVSRRYLTEEAVVFKSGILTWNADVLDKLCSTATVTSSTGKKTVKIGGVDNFDNQMYVLRFVHKVDDTHNIRVTVVGNNTAGFEIQFQPDSETVLNAEFECVPGVGSSGVLIVYTEDDDDVVVTP